MCVHSLLFDCIIYDLAVDRNVNDTLKFNQETEFIPILGLLTTQLNALKDESDDEDKDDKFPPKPHAKSASSIQANHHPALLSLLAGELSVAPEEIYDFDLYVASSYPHEPDLLFVPRALYDTQPATLGGINNEFIFSSRMDNLVSS